ncbi:hypothetical protein [Nostoc flagelliforme]|uniref:hypothetical protein n=1 Tax=Nostoc flagelliforme TaxID=1306274 RepID=UPI001F558424|nr:hypothetical protein [Nostoc flagelliforme]
MDEFVFHTQRIFNQQATVLERADGRSERLKAIMQRLDRSYEEQKSQFQEFQRITGAAWSELTEFWTTYYVKLGVMRAREIVRIAHQECCLSILKST